MKSCPNCHQSFSDDYGFCLNDGTVLEAADAPFGSDTPTQVLASFPPKSAPNSESNRNFHMILGAMAVVIIGLSAIVFFLMSDTKDEKKTNEISNTARPSPLAETSPNSISAGEKTPVPNLTITEKDAKNLLDRWERAQDGKNFASYSACYSPQQFLGIKRTNEGARKQYTYAQWMSDRRKMLVNTIDVEVIQTQIKIENDTAVAQFFQRFRSVNYCDEGNKEVHIKMFRDGAKIIFEEMKTAQICL